MRRTMMPPSVFLCDSQRQRFARVVRPGDKTALVSPGPETRSFNFLARPRSHVAVAEETVPEDRPCSRSRSPHAAMGQNRRAASRCREGVLRDNLNSRTLFRRRPFNERHLLPARPNGRCAARRAAMAAFRHP
jgi:hypothetical protein